MYFVYIVRGELYVQFLDFTQTVTENLADQFSKD